MIEFVGIGVPRAEGGWLLRRVCATFEAGQVSVVLARDARERAALLDAASGRIVPREGRVWVNRVPLMRQTARRIRGLVAEVGPALPLVTSRSALWNALVVPGPRGVLGLLRYPRAAERQSALATLASVGLHDRSGTRVEWLSPVERARLRLARALARRPLAVVVREIENMARAEAQDVLATVRTIARTHRLAALIALPDRDRDLALAVADRIVGLAGGGLVWDDLAGARGAAAR